MSSDPARPAEAAEPEDRDIPASEELAQRVGWVAAELTRCLLAAAVIAFGFFAIAGVGGWPWSAASLVFVALATMAVTVWFRSPLWITVVVVGFVMLSIAPPWLVPPVFLADGRIPLTVENQPGWVTAAIVAGLAAWLAMTVTERARAADRALRSLGGGRRR